MYFVLFSCFPVFLFSCFNSISDFPDTQPSSRKSRPYHASLLSKAIRWEFEKHICKKLWPPPMNYFSFRLPIARYPIRNIRDKNAKNQQLFVRSSTSI